MSRQPVTFERSVPRLRRGSRRSVGVFALVCALTISQPISAGPDGDEFQINQLTTGDQQRPDVAATPEGGFLVVWQSPVTPGNDADLAILGRRLDASGLPTTGDFQVNTSTTYSQRQPRISSRDDGSFVVVWATLYPGGKGSLSALQARPFDDSGSGAPGDFIVAVSPNIYTLINGHDAGAARDGDFVVVFGEFFYKNGAYSGSVSKRQFAADGTLLDSSVLANENGREIFARLGGDEAIGFVVSTLSRQYFGQYNDVEALRLDPSGTTVGSGIPIHADQPFGFASGDTADVALSPAGDFVVVWNGYDPYNGSLNQIYGRAVSVDDQPDPGGPQQISTNTTVFQRSPRIARGADGTFLSVWETLPIPGEDGLGIRGRWLGSDGAPIGDEFAVNTYTTGDQRNPEIATAANGHSFLVVWNSPSGTGDIDGLSIRGRLFTQAAIFADDFESGSAAVWSDVTP